MGEAEDEFAEAEALLQQLQSEEQQREVQAQQEVEVIELNDTNTMEVAPIQPAVKEEPKDTDVITSLNKRVTEMATLLNAIYPDNWHIYRNQEYIKQNPFLNKVITDDEYHTNHTIIAIRFPEITITNTRGHSNVIKDLFVFMSMCIYKGSAPESEAIILFDSRMCGTRATLREEEFNSNYIHSHLPRRASSGSVEKPYTSNVNVSHFCLGGGTETSAALADLNYNFDILKFELFLYQLSTYVTHESLGGGPYIRMDSIRMGSGPSFSSENNNSCKSILSNYVDKFDSFPLKSCVKDGENALVYDENNEEHLKVLGKLTSYPYERLENNRLVPFTENVITKTEEQIKELEGLMFDFRGESVFFKIIPYPKSTIKNPIKYPSNKLLSYISSCINNNIKTFNSLLYAE